MVTAINKKVSVIIPCRNEEKFIGRCLDGLIAQDYPKKFLEILVVDGASKDDTQNIVKLYSRDHPHIKLLKNPDRYTPISMNAGIRAATGDIIGTIGAHSQSQPNYISRCVDALETYHADAVGGGLRTLPAIPTSTARAIALSISCTLGTGNSKFRTAIGKGVQKADTIFNAFYKKEVFQKVGLYNKNLIRSQDIELNTRIKRAGGKLLLLPDIWNDYYPKSTLHTFFTHNILDGIWAIYPLKFVRIPLRLRHYIPLLFILGLLVLGISSTIFLTLLPLFVIILFAYSIITLVTSTLIAIKEKCLRLIPFLFLAFLARHFAYGIGSLIGGVKLFLPVSNTYGTTKKKRN